LLSACRTGGGGGYTTDWMTMHEAQEANLGNGDKPDYFQCKALVHSVKSANAIYKACPQPECNKKLIDQDNGQFRCEKCNADYPNFKYRLLVNVSRREKLCFSRKSNVFMFSKDVNWRLDIQSMGDLFHRIGRTAVPEIITRNRRGLRNQSNSAR
jgi:hypothetical protein